MLKSCIRSGVEHMEEESSFDIQNGPAQVSENRAEGEKSAVKETAETKNETGKGQEPSSTETKQSGGASPSADQDVQINFSSFILSLGTSALIHLGEERDPVTGQKSVEPANAKQVIDLISLLKEKTAGNLSKEEDHFITQLLFTLRMKFVEIEKKRSS